MTMNKGDNLPGNSKMKIWKERHWRDNEGSQKTANDEE